jgi:hypothetical protein
LLIAAAYVAGMNQLEPMPVRNSVAIAPLPEFVYLAEMTDEDYVLGFRYREIASPTRDMPRRRVVAATFFIDVSNRIVRVHDAAFNRPGYVHQCFGVGRRMRRPAWRAVQVTFPDARMALRSWRNGRDNLEFGDGVFPYIEACLPSSDEY